MRRLRRDGSAPQRGENEARDQQGSVAKARRPAERNALGREPEMREGAHLGQRVSATSDPDYWSKVAIRYRHDLPFLA